MSASTFTGFPEECLTFYKELAENNDTHWFEAHRQEFERHVMAPARLFVTAMGERLMEIAPGVVADPKVNRSLFRINRDIRFSQDKRPYKTNLALLFWEGPGKRMECPGFYFHLEPSGLMLGGGLYMFPKDLVEPYRQSVINEKQGTNLAKAVQKVVKAFKQELGGSHLKRVPKGYDKDHPLADLLLHNGLYIGTNVGLPLALHTPDLVDLCFDYYKKALPLHQWLVDLVTRA
jgi:uncharacterized protein (TIGR02453 family)